MAANDNISAENHLIARFFAPLATHPGALGLSDDTTFLTPPPKCNLVLKTDAIVENVHFFLEDAAHTVTSKTLRMNLSDLAAKDARPLDFLLSLAIPKKIGEEWLKNFAAELHNNAVLFGCPLFGSNTNRTPGPITISIAMIGNVPKGTMVRRANTKVDDRMFVSDTINDAALGIMVRNGKDWKLDKTQRQHLVSRYLLPQPHNTLAEAIRTHASAAIDISDRLVGDFSKLYQTSGVATNIDAARMPISEAAKAVIAADPGTIESALTNDDDYEIVCTVPAAKTNSFHAAAKAANVAVTQISKVKTKKDAHFLTADGHAFAFKRASFSHF